MNREELESLGLTVRESGERLEVHLELATGQLVNPATRAFLDSATLRLEGDRLVPTAPPELVGLAPVPLAYVARASDIEDSLVKAFNEAMFQVTRRSQELSALGVSPQVNTATLALEAEVEEGGIRFTLGANRAGQFRVERAVRDGAPLPERSPPPEFELSEFREPQALRSYLLALYSDGPSAPAKPPAVEPGLVSFREVVERFGTGAVLPPRSPLEVLCEVRAAGETFRFAAARIGGKTFRGLLAGASGKVWADRFELDEFPGVVALTARVLNVPAEQVELRAGGRT